MNALHEQIEILGRQVADLERHNRLLRDAVDGLLQPAPSDLRPKNMAHASRNEAMTRSTSFPS